MQVSATAIRIGPIRMHRGSGKLGPIPICPAPSTPLMTMQRPAAANLSLGAASAASPTSIIQTRKLARLTTARRNVAVARSPVPTRGRLRTKTHAARTPGDVKHLSAIPNALDGGQLSPIVVAVLLRLEAPAIMIAILPPSRPKQRLPAARRVRLLRTPTASRLSPCRQLSALRFNCFK